MSAKEKTETARLRCTDLFGLVHVPLPDAPITACGLKVSRMRGEGVVWPLQPNMAHEMCATCLNHATQTGR